MVSVRDIGITMPIYGAVSWFRTFCPAINIRYKWVTLVLRQPEYDLFESRVFLEKETIICWSPYSC